MNLFKSIGKGISNAVKSATGAARSTPVSGPVGATIETAEVIRDAREPDAPEFDVTPRALNEEYGAKPE